jgi:hypothetical protein
MLQGQGQGRQAVAAMSRAIDGRAFGGLENLLNIGRERAGPEIFRASPTKILSKVVP